MISATEIKTKMNNAAQNCESFLFCIDYEMQNGYFIENPLKQQEILWRVGNATNYHDNAKMKGSYFTKTPIPFAEYSKKFEKVKQGLFQGNSFLANLTIATPIETDFSFEEIFYRSNSPYAILVPNKFICFSPETFVKIDEGHISSNPMKGTIDGSVENAEQVILNDYKESAEHFTIVDFIRSDLSRVAKNVKVDKLRYIDHLKTSEGEILQVSSLISGDLLKTDIGDIVFALLPAGSISGAPKPSTLKILKDAERQTRSFYCGVFGYFDGKKLDSAVMIRYIEKCDKNLYFRSGGGITINSLCEDEYKEVIEKIYLPFTKMYLETIKIVDGEPQNLYLHNCRIQETIGKTLPLPTETPLQWRNGIVKCRVLYDNISIKEVSYSSYTLPKIKTLKIVECPSLDYHHKYADRNTLNTLMKSRGGNDDILITQNGTIGDTSFCNMVFENKDGLFTSDTPLLNGTKRRLLLKNGIIKEKHITTTDLHKYSKIHLINAMIDLEDNITIENIPQI
ncbi:MAG: aminodeoxychorismate synthase component I [Rikenellaceae bacterium]